MQIGNREFREVWAVDFEFAAPAGELPTPLCMVARRLEDGHTLRLWRDELVACDQPPFATDAGSVLVAYYASAELGCFLQLGWRRPANVLDLFIEFRNATNGLATPCGSGLLGALTYYGIDSIAAVEKESMRALAMRGGTYTTEERRALLDYCETDVVALDKLLPAMAPTLDIERALLRGRYMAAVASMENNGIPLDMDAFQLLQTNWQSIQSRLITAIDGDYGIYDDRTFKSDRWAAWLAQRGIGWPRLDSGALALDDDTFRYMAQRHPQVAPIRELRLALSQMRLADLSVGIDGRNRYLLSPFRAKSGRNQPSNTRSIFGPAVWYRGLIQAPPGGAVAYIDWSQQEFGIAAALSGDAAMAAAYASGDPYLAFARQAGAVPADATKESHALVRDQYKSCVLAVQYGMGAESMAEHLNQPPAVARELLRNHQRTYARYWRWSEGAVNHAMLHGALHTVFGWRVHVGAESNARMLANFPMQGNGAELLRLACIFATERGIRVCAPVHDALLVEGDADTMAETVATTQQAMLDASRIILNGFELRSDAKVFTAPQRYMDPRGQQMWDTVQGILTELEEQPCPV